MSRNGAGTPLGSLRPKIRATDVDRTVSDCKCSITLPDEIGVRLRPVANLLHPTEPGRSIAP
jgi:hypothetical protein